MLPPISEKTSNDPLARMRVYQLARELLDVARVDAVALAADTVTEKIAPQLFAAIGSIAANLAEGYSRSSGKDRARIFEIALGSARESMIWYHAGMATLGEITRSDSTNLNKFAVSSSPSFRGSAAN